MIISAGLLAGLAGLSSLGSLGSTLLTNRSNQKIANATNEMNYKISQEANATSIAEAQKNRDWQTFMSNTEVQRKMSDLEAAGINPLLAASSSGASAGSVSNPSIQAAHMDAHKNLAANIDFGGVVSALKANEQIKAYAAYLKQVGQKDDALSLYYKAKANKIDILDSSVTSAKLAKKAAIASPAVSDSAVDALLLKLLD